MIVTAIAHIAMPVAGAVHRLINGHSSLAVRLSIAALDACRQIFRKCIEDRSGRVVDTAGDSVLAAFESVVEAVRCAIEVQDALAKTNSDLPDDRRMHFRIT